MRRILWSILIVGCGVALAQTPLTAYDGGALGYRIGYPSGWVLEREGDGYLSIQPPQGSADAGRVAIELVVDPAVTDTTLEEGIEDVLAELRANLLPDLTVQSRTPTTVSGLPAVVIRLTGTVEGTYAVTYRLLVTLKGDHGYVLFLEALSDQAAAFETLFDQVQASFVLTQVQAAPPSPFAPTPFAPTPLPTAPPLPSVATPDYVGNFVGEQLLLTVVGPAVAGGPYGGNLLHGDQTYPISAQLTPQGLAGEFESGGHRYAFTAALTGDQLTFVTGGATYVLAREATTTVVPANPLAPTPAPNPLAPTPAPMPPDPAATPPDVVAQVTTSALIGALAPNGAARGRLDGIADTVTFHTYVVDLPAGVARLVVELDAEVDLDIALKHGAEILSYSDKERGGDWDYRDIDTVNPTTVIVDLPAGGLWYVDVINALGAPARHGNYRLTVTTTGGGQ